MTCAWELLLVDQTNSLSDPIGVESAVAPKQITCFALALGAI